MKRGLITKLISEHNQAVQYLEESSEKDGFLNGMKTAIDIVKNHDGWISVDDELPSKVGFYLVFTDMGRITECDYHTDNWIISHCNYEIVTHWQPLPQPPKE